MSKHRDFCSVFSRTRSECRDLQADATTIDLRPLSFLWAMATWKKKSLYSWIDFFTRKSLPSLGIVNQDNLKFRRLQFLQNIAKRLSFQESDWSPSCDIRNSFLEWKTSWVVSLKNFTRWFLFCGTEHLSALTYLYETLLSSTILTLPTPSILEIILK